MEKKSEAYYAGIMDTLYDMAIIVASNSHSKEEKEKESKILVELLNRAIAKNTSWEFIIYLSRCTNDETSSFDCGVQHGIEFAADKLADFAKEKGIEIPDEAFDAILCGED